jgi:hypothetical protein
MSQYYKPEAVVVPGPVTWVGPAVARWLVADFFAVVAAPEFFVLVVDFLVVVVDPVSAKVASANPGMMARTKNLISEFCSCRLRGYRISRQRDDVNFYQNILG